ncbi:PREDICTED: uncharacterized protein LOC105451070 [Wasmannia auropunctata]|uniref:uncharacterized protein LOC105451070 n=1 Tax=Wasmannia auropunctata TaxID=64793 RepID=UPI0005ED6055|nr:PREDICTED: uncharacterized protein LOC105451070 [Wasmannia auropunctata]
MADIHERSRQIHRGRRVACVCGPFSLCMSIDDDSKKDRRLSCSLPFLPRKFGVRACERSWSRCPFRSLTSLAMSGLLFLIIISESAQLKDSFSHPEENETYRAYSNVTLNYEDESFESSPLVRGFAIVLNNGKAAFLYMLQNGMKAGGIKLTKNTNDGY